jgi:hypothetical protein
VKIHPDFVLKHELTTQFVSNTMSLFIKGWKKVVAYNTNFKQQYKGDISFVLLFSLSMPWG